MTAGFDAVLEAILIKINDGNQFTLDTTLYEMQIIIVFAVTNTPNNWKTNGTDIET